MEEVRFAGRIDKPLLVIAMALVLFGMLMVYSTTGVIAEERFGDPLFYVKKQGMALLAGVVLMGILSRIPVEKFRKLSPFLLLASLGLLVMTLLPGIGDSAGGAKRWIHLGFVRFQPVEFVKVFMIIFFAGYVSRHEKELSSFVRGIVKPLTLVFSAAVLLLLQPDFGSACVISGVCLGMLLGSGARLSHMAVTGLVVAAMAAILVFSSAYRLQRVKTFLDPLRDPGGKGYQLVQSLIAVGSGEVTGVGLGESQQKLFFLPAAHTDFIFAVVGEELGFVGCSAVILLFLAFLWRGLVVASRSATSTFHYALALGLTLLVVFPALLNIGVVIGLLPTKGLVLPLIGFGGSSLVCTLAGIGILLGISRGARVQSQSRILE